MKKGVLQSTCCTRRHYSASPKDDVSNPLVALSQDGKTILCWHPEPQFPYEHTKPLPRHQPEIQEGDTALKVQYLLEEKYKYRKSGPTDKELMKMFFTTRHTWDYKPRKRYRKPNPPKDRDII